MNRCSQGLPYGRVRGRGVIRALLAGVVLGLMLSVAFEAGVARGLVP